MSLVSSQLLTMLCSTGYLRVKMPRLPWASSPTIAILLLHVHHDAPVSATTDHGLEHGWGRVIPSKASFARARVVTDDQWTIDQIIQEGFMYPFGYVLAASNKSLEPTD